MSCERKQMTEQFQTPYILRTLQRICQMQKEAIITNHCDGCEGGLIQTLYNTKPIAIYFSTTNILNAQLPNNPTLTTNLFRVENVINDCVILRLLVRNTTTETPQITCTNYTIVCNINCICALQCFDPICCDECVRTCGQTTTPQTTTPTS